MGLLRAHYGSVSRAGDDEEVRRRLVGMGALVVEWLYDLDKRADAKRADTPGLADEEEVSR